MRKIITLVSYILGLLLMFVIPLDALAQQTLTIKGVVKETLGEPVVGATVHVANRSIGTITNNKGEFTLPGVMVNDILSVSSVGLENKAVAIQNGDPIEIVLNVNSLQLEEVVAIGYGAMRKRDITGSLTSVSGSSFTDQMVSTAEDALMGRVAGVIVRSDKSPGGGISIQIRGSNSMLGGTEPLYVIDGFPVEPNTDARGGADTSPSQSSLNFINPDDIQSMEVLKDASATAIYGARGANGVVLITTKSGQSGATTVSYTGKFGVSQLSKKIEVLNSDEYAQYFNQIAVNRAYVQREAMLDSNIWPDQGKLGQTTPIFKYAAPGSYPWELGEGTDWQDAIYRTATSNSHTVQIQGGSQTTKMSLSLGYTKMEGIIINSDFERFTLNNSIEHKISPKLKIINRVNISRGTGNSSSVGGNSIGENRSIVSAALWTKPLYPLVTEFDESNPAVLIPIEGGKFMTNPYLLATMVTDERIATTLSNNLGLEYNIAKNLNATGTLAYSRNTNERGQYWPKSTSRGREKQGVANLSSNESNRIMVEARLNYLKKIKGGHSIDAMLATSFENTDSKGLFQEYSGFALDDQDYHNVSSATVLGVPDDYYSKTRIISYISRLNYNYKDRYLVTGTFRADGSSRAAMDKKYGYFPSIALGWRVTEESFMKPVGWINNAKLRASFGVTGSQPNAAYRSLTSLTNSNVAMGGNLEGAVFENIASNPNLTWERTDQYNIGADLSFLRSRINLTLDLYFKRTHDLLQEVNLAPSAGYNKVLMNLGEVDNRGFEFDLSSVLVKTRKSTLTFGINGAINRNKLISLGKSREYVTGVTQGGVEINRFLVGQPLGVFWGYRVEGVFRDWADVQNSSAQTDATPGEWKIHNSSVDYKKNQDGYYVLDQNGNKIPTDKQTINTNDKEIIGDPNPDFSFGLNLNYKYRNFDIGMLITGQLGGDMYWLDYQQLTNMNSTTRNVLKSAYNNSWLAPASYNNIDINGFDYAIGNPIGRIDAKFPRVYDSDVEPYSVGYKDARKTYRDMNSVYVLDGTHVKLQNISVGYTFGRVQGFKNLRISVAADNIFTISNYPGYDPTLVSSNSPMRRGIDSGSYPSQRSYTFNVQAKF